MSALGRTTVGDLTVVVVNWETPNYTVTCVDALVNDGIDPGRIVIVDNGSRDDSVTRLRARFPGCRLIELPENVGYARAANVGARALPGRAYLQMNNDAFVNAPGSVSRLVAALAQEDVGLVVPRVLYTDHTLQPAVRPLDTPGAALVRASGLSRFVPNRWQPLLGTYFDQETTRDIVATDSPVLLIRDRLWQELEGFDERLTLAQESALCWRAKDLGWRVRFVHTAEFLHVGSGSVSTKWSRPEYAGSAARAEGALIRGHLAPIPAHLSYAFTVSGLAARYVVHRAVGNDDRTASLRAQLRGYSAGFRTGEPSEPPPDRASRASRSDS